MMQPKVLVIGYGNTLRTDDGFGPVVAERLWSRNQDGRMRILSRPLLSIDLVTDLEQMDLCVLVDAATTGPRGELSRREVTPEATEIATLGHELSAASLLGVTQQVTGRTPRCLLYSVVPESMDFGESLSPLVAHLAEQAVTAIELDVAHYLDELAGRADR